MLDRLKTIPHTKLLDGKRIIITGCGFKKSLHTFYNITDNKESSDSIIINNNYMKLNIGAATAFVLAANGATVHLVSRTEENLKILKDQIINILGIESNKVEYSAVDVLDENAVDLFVSHLPTDKPLWLVKSIGLGAGAYNLKDDNPYLHIEDIPVELLEKESTIVLKGTHILLKRLLPIFRKINKDIGSETKIVIVSSMSAIRGYNLGGTHCAAKGAISRYTNSAMLDLWKEKIYLTDIRPGAIDTGMYDNPSVQKSVLEIDKEYGNNYNNTKIRLAPPISVGYSICNIFIISAHITSLNLCAYGQFPNEGS